MSSKENSFSGLFNHYSSKKELKDIKISFEFFPPKTEMLTQNIISDIKSIGNLWPKPKFISITYGAGGSDRDKTYSLVKKLIEETDLEIVPHLTSICLSKAEIKEIIESYLSIGVKKIIALRGDMPHEKNGLQIKNFDNYPYASDLVRAIKEIDNALEIIVAAYPEKHPEARSLDEDIDNLKRKEDAGATSTITQFFFDNKYIYQFMDKVVQKNISLNIIPGIILINNFKQISVFAGRCNTHIPNWINEIFGDIEPSHVQYKMIATAIATEQCRDLIDYGFKEFHFYGMNQIDIINSISHIFGYSYNKI